MSFTGHLDGVETAPGVYGDHTLTQTFTIGSSLLVVASTARHSMNVYRDGKLFANWPISSGRPGDETPNGTYLTIEKANPVDMVGPGYNIEVPWSVRSPGAATTCTMRIGRWASRGSPMSATAA